MFLYWIHTAVAAVLMSSKTQIFLLSYECVYIWSHVEAYCSERPEWAVERAERLDSSSSKRPSHMEKGLILTQKRWQSVGGVGGAHETALRLTADQLFINTRSFSTRQRETSSIFPTCRFIQTQKETKPPMSVSRTLASYLVLILTKRSLVVMGDPTDTAMPTFWNRKQEASLCLCFASACFSEPDASVSAQNTLYC